MGCLKRQSASPNRASGAPQTMAVMAIAPPPSHTGKVVIHHAARDLHLWVRHRAPMEPLPLPSASPSHAQIPIHKMVASAIVHKPCGTAKHAVRHANLAIIEWAQPHAVWESLPSQSASPNRVSRPVQRMVTMVIAQAPLSMGKVVVQNATRAIHKWVQPRATQVCSRKPHASRSNIAIMRASLS